MSLNTHKLWYIIPGLLVLVGIMLIILAFARKNQILGLSGGALIVISLILFTIICKCEPYESVSRSTAGSSSMQLVGQNNSKPDWILLVKMGSGGDNCVRKDSAFTQCKVLYTDSTIAESKGMINVDFKIDDAKSTNPLYQMFSLCQQNDWVAWNDGQVKNCDGPSGYAHDKGILTWNGDATEGIYLQHSCPELGFWSTGFMYSGGGSQKNTGAQTSEAQHFLFVQLRSNVDLGSIVKLASRANVCPMDSSKSVNCKTPTSTCTWGGFKFAAEAKTKNTPQDYLTEKIDDLTLFAKPHLKVCTGVKKDKVCVAGVKGSPCSLDNAYKNPDCDVWNYVRQNYCAANEQMEVWSFCQPDCPRGHLGKDKSSLNDIIDRVNVWNLNDDPAFNLCGECGVEFAPFKENHCKIGVCMKSNVLVVGGNNHSVNSQSPRGGIFVVIKSPKLANQWRCLMGVNETKCPSSPSPPGPPGPSGCHCKSITSPHTDCISKSGKCYTSESSCHRYAKGCEWVP